MNVSRPSRGLLAEGTIVFAVALAFRLAHVASIASLPSFRFPYEGLDADLYVRLAGQIASGDAAPHGLLHAAPFYAYWLAAFFRLFGDGLLVPRIAQALLGAASALLLWRAGGRIAGRAAGRIAAVVAAAYPPFLLYEGTLQSAALVPFFVAALAASLIAARSAKALFATGALLGLYVLARPDGLPLVALLPLALLLARRSRSGAAALLGGAVLVLLPFTVASSLRAGGFVPVSAHGGIHLYMGNHDGADGHLSPVAGIEPTPRGFAVDAKRLAESESGRELPAAEVSRHWSRRAVRWIAANPGKFAALALRKLYLFCNDYEIPNNEDLYYMSRVSPRLPGPLPLFGLLLPFALYGLLFARLGAMPRAVGAAFLICGLAGAMLFFVTARYRLPAAVALVPFAAAGAAALPRQIAGRRYAGLATLLLLVVFANLPARRFDFAAPESRMAGSWMRAGRMEEAEAAFRRALAIRPGFPEATAALAEVCRRTGRPEEALALLETLEGDPRARRNALCDRATLLAGRGDLDGAVAILEELLAGDPSDDAALTNLAACRMQQGQSDRAETLLRRALRIDPDNEEALLNLALVRAGAGDLDEGAALLARHLALAPRSPRGLFNAGVIEALRGDPAAALAFWERLRAVDPDYPSLAEQMARARAVAGGAADTP